VDGGTWLADADLQNILESLIDGGYFCSDPTSVYYVFHSARGITLMKQKLPDELRAI